MRALMIAALALAGCSPSTEKKTEESSAFAAACATTYAASIDAEIAGMKAKNVGGAERAMLGAMKARVPKLCQCADKKLSTEFSPRQMEIAAVLMPASFAHEIARKSGDDAAARAAERQARADATRIISKYGLNPADMEKIATSSYAAVAMCMASKAARG